MPKLHQAPADGATAKPADAVAPLSPNALQVLAMITRESPVRGRRIADWLGLISSEVNEAITELRSQDLVSFVGSSKAGRYQRTARSTRHAAHPAARLSPRAMEVLAVISDQPGLSTPRLAEWLGLSYPKTSIAIRELRKAQMIVFVGCRRTGGYEPVAVADC